VFKNSNAGNLVFFNQLRAVNSDCDRVARTENSASCDL